MGKRCLVIVAVLGVCGSVFLGTSRSYPRLSSLEPGRPLLQDRKRLLEIATTYESSPGPPTERPWDRTLETRMEALNRLLELQPTEKKGAVRATGRKGMGIDHRYVERKAYSSERTLLVATLSEEPDLPGRHPWFWQPKYNSDYQDYWSMDLLEFDGLGNLLRWQPYSFPD